MGRHIARNADQVAFGGAQLETVAATALRIERGWAADDLDAHAARLGVQAFHRRAILRGHIDGDQPGLGAFVQGDDMVLRSRAAQVGAVAVTRDLGQRPVAGVEVHARREVIDSQFRAAQAVDFRFAHLSSSQVPRALSSRVRHAF
jgi:hypothetical protein